MNAAEKKPLTMREQYQKDKTRFFNLKQVKNIFEDVSYNTARTWSYKGVTKDRSRSSPIVKLEVLRIGKNLFTTEDAVNHFLDTINGG